MIWYECFYSHYMCKARNRYSRDPSNTEAIDSEIETISDIVNLQYT